MSFNVRKIAAAVAAVGALAAGSANAGIVVNDWTLDLSGIDGLPAGTIIKGIDQIQFTGVAHTENLINDGVNQVGDLGRTRGLLSATSFLNNGQVITMTGLNNTFEMTFRFDVANQTTAVNGLNSNFTHLGGANAETGATGLLQIYIDNFANGGVQSSQSTGAGYDDGVLVATFIVQAGLGGVFNAGTFNGSDDAAFTWVSSLPNVIKDGVTGADLGNNALIAVTASQFDADFDNNGTPDVACPTNGTIGIAPNFSPTSFCAQEDGRASLQRVPEPATLALTGLALAGLGIARRRATRK